MKMELFWQLKHEIIGYAYSVAVDYMNRYGINGNKTKLIVKLQISTERSITKQFKVYLMDPSP